VLAESLARDQQDSNRADSPLMFDESYEVVDTSDLPIEAVVDRIVSSVRNRIS
jgi:cytidylate kinase